MARRLKALDVHADLCSMLERWVIHTLQSVIGGLGYPRKSLDFSFVTSPASSVDPTGYAAQDYSDLESALDKLKDADVELFCAIKAMYMPWTIPALVAAGCKVAPHQTYYDRIKRAHVWLESEMAEQLYRRKQMAKYG
jgi:hypothetical protein